MVEQAKNLSWKALGISDHLAVQLSSIRSFYPARWIIDDLVKNGIPLVISDDAHSVSQLGLYFDEEETLSSQLNTAKRWSL